MTLPCGWTGPIPGWTSHFMALCEVQASVAASPFVMERGVTDKLLVGARGAGAAATVMLAVLFEVPPGPLHDR